ncbi:MAG: dihydroorotase [Pygmaiobacter massiliensis]|nr:dihydroorotase [Pygmaiobacter massiliensis]
MQLTGQIWQNNRFLPGTLSICGGKVDGFGVSVPERGGRVFHFPNCIIIPGLVDVHVHLREPGFFMKETIATGTAAAAHGGYTAVCSMPNLNPVPDTPEHLAVQLEKIKTDARVRVYPYGAITMGQKGEGKLSDMEGLAGQVVAFSDDGRGVQSDELMEQAMRKAAALDKIIVAHCEDNRLLFGGYIHQGEYARLHGHKGICSESEWGPVARDLKLAQKTGCRYHVCHVSAKETVDLIRKAKAAGVQVTCETAPHYLLLNDMDLQEDGRFKMNPPIRSEEDRQALIEGILDGTIDMIVTDHAPHTAAEKAKGLSGSAMGVVGLENAFAVLYTGLVKPGVLSLEKLVELMSLAPRRVFGLCGGTNCQDTADLTVIDLEKTWTIDPERFLSKGRATPFAGWQVQGMTRMTIVEGNVVWQDNSTEK